MNVSLSPQHVFSSKYQVLRHLSFWLVHVFFFAILYISPEQTLSKNLVANTIWLPARILYCYPLMYWLIPKFLLKERYLGFVLVVLLWVVAGWYLNMVFRAYVFIPAQEFLGFAKINRNAAQQGTFLILTTTAGMASIITLFKYWFKKQHEWMQSQQEKVKAELQLLKAQVHPHFLFNTLNNIYSFSLLNSPKTPELILKLSSLLSYMLYDCKAEKVLLEKEIEVMKDYVDLERERYSNQIEISWNVEGETAEKYLVPLLLLPFLENAFKHGTSEQLEKPWLNFSLAVNQNVLKCKVVNSKNSQVLVTKGGIGIENVKKRLILLYPEKHELKIIDEGDFFVVSLVLVLEGDKWMSNVVTVIEPIVEKDMV